MEEVETRGGWNRGGWKRYCKYGHDIERVGRRPSNGACRQCDRERSKKYREKKVGR